MGLHGDRFLAFEALPLFVEGLSRSEALAGLLGLLAVSGLERQPEEPGLLLDESLMP